MSLVCPDLSSVFPSMGTRLRFRFVISKNGLLLSRTLLYVTVRLGSSIVSPFNFKYLVVCIGDKENEQKHGGAYTLRRSSKFGARFQEMITLLPNVTIFGFFRVYTKDIKDFVFQIFSLARFFKSKMITDVFPELHEKFGRLFVHGLNHFRQVRKN